MKDTYSFVARNADDPRRVITLTLHDHLLSVGTGPTLEQIEQAADPDEQDRPLRSRLWLRPLAVSLLQYGTRPFQVADVFAEVDGEQLSLKAWVRAANLRAFPITLVDGRVDNPDAALDFVEELRSRKAEVAPPFGFMELLDYWATWILGGIATLTALFLWRRRRRS